MRKRILALTLALSLLLTACGGGASAVTMRLKKTEGTVGVSDNGGKDVTPREDLSLYSGYRVDTQTESYAWVSLDEAKLAKLDQDSEIAITKEGKKLEIEVASGSLFFNVTQPLADDESMDIRTSTIMVGIRGTCGWVAQNTAALLEGTVEVTAGEQSVTISAGEMAVLTANRTLEVRELPDIPAFVLTEVGEEPPKTDGTTNEANESVDKIALLQDMNYLGDPAACQMTADQAEAFVRSIEELTEVFGGRTYGCLFDTGNGVPAMLLAVGEDLDLSASSQGHGVASVYRYVDGGVEQVPQGFLLDAKEISITIYPGSYMRVDQFSERDGDIYKYESSDFYAFGSDGLQNRETINFYKIYYDTLEGVEVTYQTDYQVVSEETFEAQLSQWENMSTSTSSSFQTASAARVFDTGELFMLENLTPNLLDALRAFAAQ